VAKPLDVVFGNNTEGTKLLADGDEQVSETVWAVRDSFSRRHPTLGHKH